MITRYFNPTIEGIFSDSHRWNLWARIERSYLQARFQEGDPVLTRRMIAQISNVNTPDRALINHFESKTGHDVVAFLSAYSAVIDDPVINAQLHMGLTSSDLVDNALFMQLEEVREWVLRGLSELVRMLEEWSDVYTAAQRLGRTHGQVAEVTTFGWRFEVWMRTASMLYEQGLDLSRHITVWKTPGAVGNMRLLGKAVANRAAMLNQCTLLPSTQVIPRQRLVVWAQWMVAIMTLIEEIAMEIRLSSRSEIREMREGRAADRVGSSAMPHKKNPIQSERLSGFGRVARSYLAPIMETAGNLHNERDISNSSVERIIVPDLSHLVAFSLAEMLEILKVLDIDTVKAGNNVAFAKDSALVQYNLQRLGLPYVEANEETRHWAAEGGWDYDRILPLVNKYRPDGDEEIDTQTFLSAVWSI